MNRATVHPFPAPSRVLVAGLACAIAACSSSGSAGGASGSASASVARSGSSLVLEAAENQGSAVTSSTAKPAEDPIVAVPAGKLVSGSTPGDPGRDPTL